jgi:DNA-binding response OmpR family regulator
LAGTVVIVRSALATSDEVAAGADHYLTKPFSPAELGEVIDRLVGE